MKRLRYLAPRLLLVALSFLIVLIPIELYLRGQIHQFPSMTQADDATLYRLRPNLNVVDRSPGDYRVRYTTNNLGVRGSADVEIPKPEDTYRILGLGDSFTFGVGVEDDETFLALLEDQLQTDATADKRIEVVNAGVAGWGTSHQLAYLIDRGFALEPDLIIIGTHTNDLNDNIMSGLHSLDENGALRTTPQDEVPPYIDNSIFRQVPFYTFFANNFATMAWLRNEYTRFRRGNFADEVQETIHTNDEVSADTNLETSTPDEPPLVDPYESAMIEALMQEIVRLADERDIPVVFMTMHARWNNSPLERKPFSDHIIDLCIQNDLICLDTNPLFLELGMHVDDLYYKYHDNHWKPIAHTFVVEYLYNFLLAQEALGLPLEATS